MLDKATDELKSSTEKAESFVDWLAEIVARKKWLTILLLIDAALFFIFNLPAVQAGLSQLPGSIRWFYWLIMAGVTIAAFIVAVRTKRRKVAAPAADFAERRAIKGLRPFGFDDAEIFARLQREDSLRECLEAVTDRDFRFGVLCGESGCGKTSFLQAGLWPRLLKQKTPHRCVYVKLSDLDPLDSVRQAFAEQLQLSKDQIASADFLTLLEAALAADSKPLVLLFDQFEQFFVQRKTKEARKPFVQALATWYTKRPPLSVKILIGIRGDYSDRLIELQKAMGYSLGVHNNFRLEKFTPKEATEVFRVIAETEGFSFDESFVRELTEHELASRDDGRISPVDLQILAWMIRGQAGGAERAFNRVTYQKLGGIEGLLEKFLSLALGARETEARRQAALKVLLGLTDLEHGVRAGVLTVPEVQQKLADTVSESEVRDALEWLGRGDIRLITPSQRDGALGYELAHERLIPALRRLAGKELSEVDQANELLDRRVNEWEGNKRDRRYLLRWRELRQIKQQQPYLVWGKQEIQKRELLKQSRRRLLRRTGALAGTALVLLLTWLVWPSLIQHLEQQRAQQRREGSGINWVTVAGDTFTMGDVWGDGDPDEKPVHLVRVADFKMSSAEITNAQYCKFLNERGVDEAGAAGWIRLPYSDLVFRNRQFLPGSGKSDHPITGVTWYGAEEYAEWLGGRLPLEDEWEFAARSRGRWDRKYPWGDEFDQAKVNCYSDSTMAVRSFPPNSLGLYDMAGNVWEWCLTPYRDYPDSARTESVTTKEIDAMCLPQIVSRVVRGGAFNFNPRNVRCSNRFRNYPDLPDLPYNYVGFRVALSP